MEGSIFMSMVSDLSVMLYNEIIFIYSDKSLPMYSIIDARFVSLIHSFSQIFLIPSKSEVSKA